MDILSIAKGSVYVCNKVFLNVCFVSCRHGIGTIESGLTSMRDHRRLTHNLKHPLLGKNDRNRFMEWG